MILTREFMLKNFPGGAEWTVSAMKSEQKLLHSDLIIKKILEELNSKHATLKKHQL